MFDMETGMPALEFFQGWSMVGGRVVQEGDHGTA
jgi:hypothetical protein